MKIEQDSLIAIQMAKALQGHEGPLTINVKFEANNNTEVGVNKEIVDVYPKVTALPMEDEALLALIETFPPPRLKNFIKHIAEIAKAKFGGDEVQACLWLGCDWNTVKKAHKRGPVTHYRNDFSRKEIVDALEKVDWRMEWAAVDLKMGRDKLRRICSEQVPPIIPPWGSWLKRAIRKEIENKQ